MAAASTMAPRRAPPESSESAESSESVESSESAESSETSESSEVSQSSSASEDDRPLARGPRSEPERRSARLGERAARQAATEEQDGDNDSSGSVGEFLSDEPGVSVCGYAATACGEQQSIANIVSLVMSNALSPFLRARTRARARMRARARTFRRPLAGRNGRRSVPSQVNQRLQQLHRSCAT